MSTPFTTNISDGIAEMILDHPPVNAFDSAGWFAIADEIDALGVNDDVRVIVIAAAGKGFCAGVDIKELAADSSKIVDVNKGNYETFRAIHRNPKPVIVALHSFVLGGGIGMAGAADIILCSDCARLVYRKLIVERWVAVPTCSECSRYRKCDTCTSPVNSLTPRRLIALGR